MTRVYEVTLPGFDAGTDETDHLVLWVKVSDKQEIVDAAPAGATVIRLGKLPDCDIDFTLPRDAQAMADFVLKHAPKVKPVVPHCRHCGSTNVTGTGSVTFDPATEQWKLVSVFDGGTCQDCHEDEDKYFDWSIEP